MHFILNLQRVSLCFLQRDDKALALLDTSGPIRNLIPTEFLFMVKKKDGGVKGIELASERHRNGIHHLLAVRHWANYLTSLSLSSLVY